MVSIPFVYKWGTRAYGVIQKLFLEDRALYPLNVLMEITYHCNLKCDFCQFGNASSVVGSELPSDFFRDVALSLPSFTVLSFSGGEPFVKPGFFPLLEALHKKRRIHIFTNGTLIGEEKAYKLVSWAPSHLWGKGILVIGFSVEGLAQLHDSITGVEGSFSRAEEAIRWLVDAKKRMNKRFPAVEVKVVITPDNLGNIPELYEWAVGLGVDLFDIMALNTMPHEARIKDKEGDPALPLPPPPFIPEEELMKLKRALGTQKQMGKVPIRLTPQGVDFSYFLSHYRGQVSLEDYSCEAPWTTFGVNPYGSMYICPYVRLGNLRETPWRVLYNSPRAQSFRRRLKNGLFQGCEGCCFLRKKKG